MPVVLGAGALDLQQLEVGLDARQRCSQLVGGIGDELTLPLERLLPLGAGLVERLEHAVHRAGQLADFVVGRGDRDSLGGVASTGDLARQVREGLDRAHGAIGDCQSGEEREQRSTDDAGTEEEPETGDGFVHTLVGARVLDVRRE